MKEPFDLRGKYRGALLGGAIGDALGAPFEVDGITDEELGLLELWSDPLRYTDDTTMTIGVAKSFLACGGFDGAHMAMQFCRDYRAEPWRGYGSTPRRVCASLEDGVPWDKAARRVYGGAGSRGNGAAMRVAPTALAVGNDPVRAAELARQTSRVTHTHELGVEGAVLQAVAVATLLANEAPRGTEPFLAALRPHLQTAPYQERLDRIAALPGDAEREAVVTALGNSGAALEAVSAALYAFLRNRGSFTATVTYAIGLNGDTDTIAAMAGTLAGADLGEASIPATWRERVEGAAELQALADALYEMAGSRRPA